jgi:acetylornithine deacetylase
MTRILDRLSQLEQQWGLYEHHPLMPPGTMAMCPVQISGGGMQATTADACSAVIAVTLSPNRSCAEVLDEIKKAVDAVCVGDPWLSKHPPVITYPFLHTNFDPINIPVGDPAVVSLAAAVRQVTANQAPIELMPTPSDANLFAAAGQPSMVCGPGQLVGNGVHGLDEHIDIDEVVKAAKIYATMVLDWCWQTKP